LGHTTASAWQLLDAHDTIVKHCGVHASSISGQFTSAQEATHEAFGFSTFSVRKSGVSTSIILPATCSLVVYMSGFVEKHSLGSMTFATQADFGLASASRAIPQLE